jgi:2-oxoglutarate ferredoxin oxidoreductase subunit alpha
MNLGQMVDDIKVSLHHQNIPIAFFGRTGGVIPEIEEIVDALKVLMSPKENYAK